MALDNVFTGRYFDGKTSRSRPCLITLKADGLLVAFTDDLGPADTFWHLEGVHPAEFNDAQHTKLQFGPYPREVIEVDGRALYDALKVAYPSSHFTTPSHAVLSRFGWRGLLFGVVVAVSILGSAYVWIIPAVADTMAQQMPRAVEANLGREMAANEIFGETNAPRSAALQGFVRHLRLDDEVPIEARVVDSPVLNAYASLGGYLHFHSALVDSISRPEQLAGLVAHEYAHVKHRHSLRALYRASANYIVLGAIFGDATGLSGVLLQQAEQLGSLAFSRDQEAEADATAHVVLAERGLDRKGMAELFSLLKRSDGGDGVPVWLSTHPDLDARIAGAEKPLDQPLRTGVRVNADSLQFYFAQLKTRPQAAAADSAKTEAKGD